MFAMSFPSTGEKDSNSLPSENHCCPVDDPKFWEDIPSVLSADFIIMVYFIRGIV